MHIQIITFQLKDFTEDEYHRLCDEVASSFASVPGLLSKVWLADSSRGTYGGVYFWSHRGAMEEFAETELFHTVATHPHLTNIRSTDFAVMEKPSKITRGFLIAD